MAGWCGPTRRRTRRSTAGSQLASPEWTLPAGPVPGTVPGAWRERPWPTTVLVDERRFARPRDTTQGLSLGRVRKRQGAGVVESSRNARLALHARPRHRARAAGQPRARRAAPRRRARRERGDRRRRARPPRRGARARPLPARVRAAVAVLPPCRAGARARGRTPSRAAARLVLRMRDLPRQLSEDELAELFEGRTRLVELLAAREDPLGSADDAIDELDEAGKLEALNAHPPIGAPTGLSERSAAEQGDDADPAVLTELGQLNQVYEQKFGFRFVVFVNGRPKAEILEVLRGRLERARDEELDTALHELVAIARDRWERG